MQEIIAANKRVAIVGLRGVSLPRGGWSLDLSLISPK